MSDNPTLLCRKCRVESDPDELVEVENNEDNDIIADLHCPQCHGSNFTKIPAGVDV